MRNPLSIEAFADWCEKQPADATFLWWDACNCAGAQYAAFLGVTDRWHDRAKGGFWWDLDVAIFLTQTNTFGSLAASLREVSHA